jgi:hypothetical protein
MDIFRFLDRSLEMLKYGFDKWINTFNKNEPAGFNHVN